MYWTSGTSKVGLRPKLSELNILVAEPLRVDSDSTVDVVNCAEDVVFYLGGSTHGSGSATKISARQVASRSSSQEGKLCWIVAKDLIRQVFFVNLCNLAHNSSQIKGFPTHD